MSIVETSDKDLLRRIFARDPIAAIYMLGDLDDRAFPDCRWFVDGDRGVLLLYTGLAVPMVVTFGEAGALPGHVPLPPRFYTKLRDTELPGFAPFRLNDPDELYVMGLERLVVPPPVPRLKMTRVTDSARIAALYQHYPGNYFASEQVPAGFYAAAELDGDVIAAAGTHAWAPAEGAAAIGNVVTAAPYRGRGVAGALLAWLCQELAIGGCRHVGLHVNRFNHPAIACYHRIGFRIHSEITQWTATLRQT